MTQDGEFKAIVRARMAITGEKHTRAMRAVLEAARAAIPQPPGDDQQDGAGQPQSQPSERPSARNAT